uniref:Uncharacterized protein n=1 Tax=Quercus lobata TaxID=97700 RepID=A0A7N2MRW0_QUELO
MVDDDGGEVKGGEIPRFEIKVTHEAKLNEILHKINSIEIKLCSDGVKDFIKLLKEPKVEEGEHLLRKAFAGFALLFLRWLLQQKEMYFGVILGLGNDDDDDDETFIYVLSILQDRVLVEESLVPLVMTISHNLLGFSISILSSIFFLEQSLLTGVSKLWLDTIIPGWEMTLLLFIVKPEEMMPVRFLKFWGSFLKTGYSGSGSIYLLLPCTGSIIILSFKWRCAGENKSANMQLVRALNALVRRLSLEARSALLHRFEDPTTPQHSVVSLKSNGFDPKISNRFKLGTLQSLLDLIENECDESFKNRFGSEDYWLSTASWHYLLSAPLSYICTVSSFLCLQFSVITAPVVHAGLLPDAVRHSELHYPATPPDIECLFHACILVAAEDRHLT